MQHSMQQHAYAQYPPVQHHHQQLYRIQNQGEGEKQQQQQQAMLTASSNLDPSGSAVDLISQGSSISTRGVASSQQSSNGETSGPNNMANYMAPNQNGANSQQQQAGQTSVDSMASGSNQVVSTISSKRQAPGTSDGGNQMQMPSSGYSTSNLEQAQSSQMLAPSTFMGGQMQQQQQYQQVAQQSQPSSSSSSSSFAPRHLMLQQQQQSAPQTADVAVSQQTFNGQPMDQTSALPGGQDVQQLANLQLQQQQPQPQHRSPILNQLSRLWSMVGSRNKSLLASLPPFGGNLNSFSQRQQFLYPTTATIQLQQPQVSQIQMQQPQQQLLQQQQPPQQMQMQQQPLQLNSIQLAPSASNVASA